MEKHIGRIRLFLRNNLVLFHKTVWKLKKERTKMYGLLYFPFSFKTRKKNELTVETINRCRSRRH